MSRPQIILRNKIIEIKYHGIKEVVKEETFFPNTISSNIPFAFDLD